MLKGLASLRQMEILGIDNSSDLAARVSKGQLAPPTVLIFKYKYAANEKVVFFFIYLVDQENIWF